MTAKHAKETNGISSAFKSIIKKLLNIQITGKIIMKENINFKNKQIPLAFYSPFISSKQTTL